MRTDPPKAGRERKHTKGAGQAEDGLGEREVMQPRQQDEGQSGSAGPWRSRGAVGQDNEDEGESGKADDGMIGQIHGHPTLADAIVAIELLGAIRVTFGFRVPLVP
ncbi:hypothetical protein CPLU01_06360 [Colletotrichum plurivorum]|uniref:Uncharacterized protein n=1 Tax=Colletotrichum plurivorum TaxID=2175906 RepID=A0A8H6NG28_9PEZI|nr:hypothetical protein CPLU01_06360 [Colletotrichum plurivorum]